MERVTKFNHDFIVRHGSECQEMWEDDPVLCPKSLITFAATDGEDGLMWSSWEFFWAEYGIHNERLNAQKMIISVLDQIPEEDKQKIIELITE